MSTMAKPLLASLERFEGLAVGQRDGGEIRERRRQQANLLVEAAVPVGQAQHPHGASFELHRDEHGVANGQVARGNGVRRAGEVIGVDDATHPVGIGSQSANRDRVRRMEPAGLGAGVLLHQQPLGGVGRVHGHVARLRARRVAARLEDRAGGLREGLASEESAGRCQNGFDLSTAEVRGARRGSCDHAVPPQRNEL
jgi:hypothetical protein